MPGTKLTKSVVDAAEARESRYVLFDDEVKGFGLRVYPSGAKTWVYEYKPWPGGRGVATKRYTIGDAAKVTASIARTEAKRLQAMVQLRGDPQAEKEAERLKLEDQRTALTVKALASDFLLNLERLNSVKAGTLKHYRDIIDRIIVPAVGKRVARDLPRSEVKKLHTAWAHTPFQANRVLAVISSMYGYAAGADVVPEGYNPAKGVDKYDEAPRGDLFKDEELARLGAALREAETVGIPWEIDPTKKLKHLQKDDRVTRIGQHAAAAIRLLLFTGCRLREILHLKWEHVDLNRGLLLFPDHKLSKKQGIKTAVLNAPAVEVLSTLPRMGKYVIAGASAGEKDERPRSDLKKPWAMVTKRAELEGRRLHDLRHNYASFGASAGMGLQIVGKLLGHSQASTTQRYSHLDADPLRRASNTIATAIAAQMGERPAAEPNNVVTLPKRAS